MMETSLTPTYAFEDDMVFAFFENNRIASGPVEKIAEVEKGALEYLEEIGKERKTKSDEKKKKAATHIVSPNGMEGEIISRVNDVWGQETVTVRLANNQIRSYEIHGGEVYEDRTKKASSPIEALQSKLDTDYTHDKRSLALRIRDLEDIRHEASIHLAKGASYEDERKLSEVALAADAEKAEVREALSYLEQSDAEAFAPFKADYKIADANGIDKSHGTWLDNTVQDMIDEAEGEDLESYLDEGPGQFVADLDSGALADTGVTREMATAHIISKTAAFAGQEVEDYRESFIAAIEIARRAELADRTSANHKVAAVKHEAQVSGPDDMLFI